jgi:hypothetical protein
MDRLSTGSGSDLLTHEVHNPFGIQTLITNQSLPLLY